MSPAVPRSERVFRHRPFALFWIGRLAATIATQTQGVAIGWQVYTVARLTHTVEESAFLVGMVGLVQFLPLFFLALIAVPVAYTWLDDAGEQAARWRAAKRKSPERSPVKTRPLRFPPCAAGARPTTVMEAAATSATAAMDLRMDLSSSRGSTNPSPAKIHERPRKGKVFLHQFFGHHLVTMTGGVLEIQEPT